ncbi:MAG: hypothetical protein GWN16_05110, partial [Calditrichae bacterium]|nr:hypothetical protein [Calditrichia bacterium]
SLRYRWERTKSEIQIGDYDLATGHRLVFSNAYGQLLSIGNQIPFTQTQLNWRGKYSANESSFLRGALWDYSLAHNTTLLVAFSDLKTDATLTDDSSAVRSIYISGYHRTDNESGKKNQMGEKVFAGVIRHHFSNLEVGIQVA